MKIHVIKLKTTDSTNSEAASHARAGAAEGLCVIARHQSAGRGRQGRQWVSDRDSGLYFSVLLRPKIEPRFLPLITLMAGVAVFETLKEFGMPPDIKWVNDLLVNDKKIAGILAETVDTPTGLAVVVGIGINLTSRNLPNELAETATSIEDATGRGVYADEAATVLTRHLSHFYSILQAGGSAHIVKEWQLRSTYFRGKNVRVCVGNENIHGVTDGLEESGALRLTTSDGSIRVIQAGDVQLVRKV